MKNLSIVNIINEEISNFDFLGNDSYSKQRETSDLIENEDFQNQFILDSINKPEKIKQSVSHATVGGDWQNNESGTLRIEYFTEITYSYDQTKEPVKFTLDFSGYNVSFTATHSVDAGDNMTPDYKQDWFDFIDWSEIDVTATTPQGDTIEFTALQKQQPQVRDAFFRKYLERLIENKTNQSIEQN